MSEEEYNAEIDGILKALGGSFSTPAGFSDKVLYFQCIRPTIVVPLAHFLTPEERKVVIDEFRRHFSNRI